MLEYRRTLNLRLETIYYSTHFLFFDNQRFSQAFDGVLSRKMPKKSQAKWPKTDWSIFVQQPDTQGNPAHADSTKEYLKHFERKFKRWSALSNLLSNSLIIQVYATTGAARRSIPTQEYHSAGH